MKLTKKLLWTSSLIAVFLVSMTMINVTSASPDPYFSVDPSLIEGTPTGSFMVNISVTDAPSSYAWEVYLSWDPNRLELVYISEGDFLHRWMWVPFPPPGGYVPKYLTSLVYVPLDEANVEGEIIIGCSLVGDPATVDWASGDGWLVTLGFAVKAEGNCVLDLFNTRLWDDIDPETGYPVPHYYSNFDGVVEATNFYNAGLAEWELKVNSAAGIGKGHKSTVGEENMLEAYVTNTGTFNVDVQVFFEIMDAAGFWVATIPSSVVTLPAGESTILSGTWTADNLGYYYITAYSFYSAPPVVPTPTIADGFSRTLRLRMDLPP